ncbi:MAG: MoaD/ThiS family protein [Proteobacteria bacterium]|nr:MoaD/ThiS family protein [Pseudomonadota bacterium]
MTRVLIPSALRSYTKGGGEIDADGATLAELVRDLDAKFPGLRFRIVDEQDQIRTHVRFTVNAEIVSDLSLRVSPGDEVAIIMAFSGG